MSANDDQGRTSGRAHDHQLDSDSYDLVEIAGGQLLRTHPASDCLDVGGCPIHNPSDHPLRNAPLVWADELRLLFRRCPCGALHPDPDSLAFNNTVALLRTLAGEYGSMPLDGWHPCCSLSCCGYGRGMADELGYDVEAGEMIARHLNDGGGTESLWESVDRDQ